MNETMARSLTPKELAEEFRYHDDPGVAQLARAMIDRGISHDEMEQLEEAAEMRAEEAAAEIEDLKQLLSECEDELPDSCKDLRQRIVDALA